MWKKVLIGSAALAIAGSSFVVAQQRFNGPDRLRSGTQQRWRLGPDDMAAFTDARIAALKAGLRLTPDQDKNWPAFETALRNMAKLRADRIAAMRARSDSMRNGSAAGQQQGVQPGQDQAQAQSQTPPAGNSPVDRLERFADAAVTRAAALKQLADAATPLYNSLDDAQKRRFMILAHFAGERRHQHFAAWREPFGHDGFGRGFNRGAGPRPDQHGFDQHGSGGPRFGQADEDDTGSDAAHAAQR